MSETANNLLDIAERLARQGGYNNFSFREIAKEAGIKSASVHYHYPTKEDMGIALVQRYTDRFLDSLGAPGGFSTPQLALNAYIKAYRAALIEDGQMCLCGILGAEIEHLPPLVAKEASNFFARNIEWLTSALTIGRRSRKEDHKTAMKLIATLEGAMIVARSLNEPNAFDDITQGITA